MEGQFEKEDIITALNESEYAGRYKIYNTFLEQNENRWRRGFRSKFEKSLVEDDIEWFTYIKFYIDGDKKIGIVAGQSGTRKVNSNGCDLSFSVDPTHGNSRQFLLKNNKEYCQTEILVIAGENHNESFEIERNLKRMFTLFGS